MSINARNLAAALVSLGADVETALLDLAAVSPMLDAKVRGELYRHETLPRLQLISSRVGDGLVYVHSPLSRPICAMHAVDAVTRFLDDEDVVRYLKAQFPEHRIEDLCTHR